jgi:hypothetical protein
MSDYPMLISNKLHSFRNFDLQIYFILMIRTNILLISFIKKKMCIFDIR